MISLSNDVLCSLLELVSLALQHNISERQELTIDQEEEEEDDVAMDLDPLGGDRALIHCIIDIINSQLFIKRLNNIQGYPSPLLKSLCSVIYHMLMISSRPYLHFPLIRSLSFSSPLLRHAWSTITSLSLSRLFGPSVNCLDQLCRGSSLPSHMGVILLELLSSFSPLLSVSLSSLHDSEVASHGPFSLTELAHISLKLKDVFIALHLETHLSTKALYSKTTPIDDERPHPSEWKQLSNLLCHVLRQLYERNVHLQFLSSEGWSSLSLLKVPPELFYEQEDNDDDNVSPPVIVSRTVMKHAELLKKAPFVFPFIERVNFFQRLIAHSRTATQGHFQDFVIGPSIDLTIRRSHLYEDAFSKLSRADMRNKLRVTLVNAQGLDEAGIDGGGVFREFLSETIKTGYDPDRGFFVVSPDGGLYPNPHVHTISDSYHLHYHFLGALLGKVLFEHMLVELPFASFFIRKLTIGGRGWVDTHHLSSLDPELYHHLLSLKEYTGDIEDLELDFTASVNEYGQTKVIELKAGGGSQIVNHSNLIQYIHLLAHYHLNVQINQQFKSFRYGLNSVIPLQWLTLFNEHELQTLISGARVSIDVEDLRKNTQYSGTYDEDHPTIQLFWDVVQQFSEERKQELLKFVTSCSRPPLLGFSQLHPPFTILSSRDPNYLPSASTCMHLLKLPMFNDKQTMRDKLIYSISSGAGFELS
jgi:ubiquitin-protein ligase E3 C